MQETMFGQPDPTDRSQLPYDEIREGDTDANGEVSMIGPLARGIVDSAVEAYVDDLSSVTADNLRPMASSIREQLDALPGMGYNADQIAEIRNKIDQQLQVRIPGIQVAFQESAATQPDTSVDSAANQTPDVSPAALAEAEMLNIDNQVTALVQEILAVQSNFSTNPDRPTLDQKATQLNELIQEYYRQAEAAGQTVDTARARMRELTQDILQGETKEQEQKKKMIEEVLELFDKGMGNALVTLKVGERNGDHVSLIEDPDVKALIEKVQALSGDRSSAPEFQQLMQFIQPLIDASVADFHTEEAELKQLADMQQGINFDQARFDVLNLKYTMARRFGKKTELQFAARVQQQLLRSQTQIGVDIKHEAKSATPQEQIDSAIRVPNTRMFDTIVKNVLLE